MFSRILIANRGEIAVRIAATARRMGIETVAIYSEADAGALHVRVADRAVCVGPAEARRSYLDAARIIEAARSEGAEAIHPGYGFLSEHAPFAEACAAAGLVFIGPPASAIRSMGSKAEAKALMERAGVPIVPGYHGEMQDAAFLKRKAYEVGYPVLIKAVAGGGGKGMRRVDKALDFDDAFSAAKREAAASFGDDRVLVERFVNRPRHVEIQVFADTHGNTVSLHERDCSLQRRHQKVIEEAPAPGMTPQMRAEMGEAAVRAAEAVGYVGAGTVEFIAEGGDGDGDGLSTDGFFFMEMNTRLQVEHPVTEAVTGFDLVEWQLRVAAGEPLPTTEIPAPAGHAVEARIYAEDPDNGFLPSAGPLKVVRWPRGDGIRVDTGVDDGDEVSPHYDPMVAKLIVTGRDRDAAWGALADALAQTAVLGTRTNLAFLRALAAQPDVLAGRHDTGLVDRELAALTGGAVSAGAIADAAATLLEPQMRTPAAAGWQDPWAVSDAFRISGGARREVPITLDGKDAAALLDEAGGRVLVEGVAGTPGSAHVILAAGGAFALDGGRAVHVAVMDQLSRQAEVTAGAGATAPMHGRIVEVFVAEGEEVAQGARLFAIEAMKMEHTVKAPRAARVVAVHHDAGDQVAEGAEVIVLEPLGEAEAQ